MFTERNCRFCMEIFTPTTANQQYCCNECRRTCERERERERIKSQKAKQRNAGFRNFPKIDEIVDVCETVREQTGKIVSYGWVSYLSECGKIDTLGVNL